jgi:deoxyribose-phosphate aldolase
MMRDRRYRQVEKAIHKMDRNLNLSENLMKYTREEILRTLDLAVLKPNASSGDVIAAARTVEELDMASVCVAPCNVALAKRNTHRVCSVAGFPHGDTTPHAKRREIQEAIDHGAVEIDMVINVDRFLDGTYPVKELRYLGEVRERGVKSKAILEVCYLDLDEIAVLCDLCVNYEINWVKTSTGFGPGGATPEAVQVMVKEVNGRAQVKAAGGIKTYTQACHYLNLGCTRLGVGAASYEGLLP